MILNNTLANVSGAESAWAQSVRGLLPSFILINTPLLFCFITMYGLYQLLDWRTVMTIMINYAYCVHINLKSSCTRKLNTFNDYTSQTFFPLIEPR